MRRASRLRHRDCVIEAAPSTLRKRRYGIEGTPSRFLSTLLLLGGIATAGAVSLAAQQAPDAQPLSLEAAMETALEHSPTHRQARSAVVVAEYGERASLGSAYLPSVYANLGFRGNTFRRRTAEDDFGRPIGGTEVIENTTSSTSQGVGARLTLLDLGQWRDYSRARAETSARVAAVDASAARLRTQVGQAYYQAARADRLTAVEARQLESARRQLAAVRALLRVAARQPTDVLGAELQVARAEQSLQRAEGEARKARLRLKELMGVDLEGSYELTTGFPAVFDPAALDADGLIATAVRVGPAAVERAAELETYRRALAAARADWLPTVSGDLSWGRSTSAENYAAIGDFNPPNQSWGFGISVDLPLFSRFATGSRIGQAETRVEIARAALRETRLQVERSARSALIDLRSAFASVRLAERSADLARSRLEQGRELYRLGSLGYTDLQRMFDDVAAAERGVVDARASFADALLALEQTLGTTVDAPAADREREDA